MKREDININETFDLSYIYQDTNEFNNDLVTAKNLLEEIVNLESTFLNSAKELFDFLEKNTYLNRLVSKMYCYTHLNVDVIPDNQEIKTLEATIMALYEDVTVKLTFIDLKIIDNQELVKSYLEDDILKSYKYSISETLRQAKHTLSKEMEDFMATIHPLIDTGSDVFDALRLEFEPVKINDKEEFLNSATLTKFLKNKDEKIRKQAYTNFFKEYKRFENVFAKTLSSVMKKDAFIAKTRNFEDSLAASLFADNAPKELFYKILDQANTKHIDKFHRYNALKKKLLNKETLYNYDLNVPLVNSKSRKYTIEQCFDIILETTKPFGEEYTNIIKQAKAERWIDFHPHVGKRAGAYSSGSYDTKPYILMNFIGDYNSLSTMTHELGHSCHTYLSTKYQKPENSSYRIFVAEVSSTVNEMLLINHLLNTSNDEKEKASLLYDLLENCVGLIYRQPMFADFELKLHQMAENNEPMSSQRITDLYEKLNQDYFGENVALDELTKYSCYYIPHFYYNYYVYKYTLGMCCALAITARILDGDTKQVENYLTFLKSGGSMEPLELLKVANVNPLEDSLYNDAYSYFDKLLQDFTTIMERGA